MSSASTVDTGSPGSDASLMVPYKVLQDLVASQGSGRLTVSDESDRTVQWRAYLGAGKIHYATSSTGHRERLNYLLKRYFPHSDFVLPDSLESDYQYICQLWQQGVFSLQQVRQVLGLLTQEALIHLLARPKAAIRIEKTLGLDPLVLSLPLKELITPVRGQIRQWLQLYAEISSPFQRLILGDLNSVGGQSWLEQEDYQFIAANRPFFEQRLSLYEIAQQTGKNTLQLATLLQPLINAGAIQLHEYELPSPEQQQRTSGPLIACIDDSKATQQIVKMTLESIGYRVINVVEPAKALTTFVRQRPALILMDINMPEIDGYELCSMFQKSTLLRDIPIVMLTGRDGLIDRIRARMVGAVNFIAKPFSPQELVNLVQSHLTGNNE